MTIKFIDKLLAVLIIIALIAIFIPILFTHNKIRDLRISFSHWMPVKPLSYDNLSAMRDADQLLNKVAGDVQNYNKLIFKSIKANQENLKKYAQAKPNAWIVQIDTWYNYAQSHSLVKKLQAKGFAAYVKHIPLPGPVTYKILVGPVITREEAQILVKNLLLITKKKTSILRYDPISQ